MQKKKVIVVVGPTASGKSTLAFNIAKDFGGFLISADSRQIFKDMDIGTNKDKGKWLRKGLKKTFYVDGIEECLVDFLKPSKYFSLDDWLNKTKDLIRTKRRLPVVVGGTGLYTTALVKNYELPSGYNKSLRKKIKKDLAEFGVQYLVKQLLKIDPDIDQKIDIENPRRVCRALELYSLKDDDSTEDLQLESTEFEFLQIGKTLSREELYFKINKRVDEMIDEGLIDEVKKLQKKGYKKDSPAITGIGYRQVIEYLEGNIDLKESIRLIKRDTRRYAKRQLTWYKRHSDIHWVENYPEAKKLIKTFLK